MNTGSSEKSVGKLPVCFKIMLPVLAAVFKSWIMLSGYVGVFRAP